MRRSYQLVVELLQLVSHDGVLGNPDAVLWEGFRKSYLRECGFALLDVGDLFGAEDCFSQLLSKVFAEGDPTHEISALLDLSLVKQAQNRLDECDNLIESAEAALTRLVDQQDKASRTITQLRRRVAARKINSLYVRDQVDAGIGSLETFITDFGEIVDPDLTHIQIAAFSRAKASKTWTLEEAEELHKRAFQYCLKAVFRVSSLGLQHEAMGLRIALAHLFRKRGDFGSAETICGEVHTDILKFGCSERTFIAFQLEAGRILFDQGRYLRLYASYLRACALRCDRLGFGRDRRTARTYAVRALAKIRKDCALHGDQLSWEKKSTTRSRNSANTKSETNRTQSYHSRATRYSVTGCQMRSAS